MKRSAAFYYWGHISLTMRVISFPWILNLLTDSMRLFLKPKRYFSYWFLQNLGFRIDLCYFSGKNWYDTTNSDLSNSNRSFFQRSHFWRLRASEQRSRNLSNFSLSYVYSLLRNHKIINKLNDPKINNICFDENSKTSSRFFTSRLASYWIEQSTSN